MKKQAFLVLTIAFSLNSFAQISFEKGYFIDDDGKKTECFIENVDWKNNPTEFKYKLSENSKPEKATIETVKEFSIINFSKYVRESVKIDRSSNDLNQLSSTRNPVFKDEILFLEVLVEGKSNLYYYEDGNLIRFFYNRIDNQVVEQLIFKNYLKENNYRGENNMFRQQLLNNLKCSYLTSADIETTEYNKEDLTNFFTRYNQCDGSKGINYHEKQKRDLFNLSLRPGVNFSSLSTTNEVNSSRNVDFGNELGIRFGIEGEFLLPFNKNKWAIIVEVAYQQFDSEVESPTSVVDYQSIEIPLGIRHYFFLNENSKLFINGSYVLDNVLDSKVTYSSTDVEITRSTNFGFGLGYKKNDRYSLELRYYTSRNVFNDLVFYDSDYNTLSIIFGYSLF